MKYKYMLLFILMFSISEASKVNVIYEKVEKNSAYWPYRVKITKDFYLENKSIRAGIYGILIRIEESTENSPEDLPVALCDFGGHGVLPVPLDYTDIVAQFQEYTAEIKIKETSNYALLLAGKLIGTINSSPVKKVTLPIIQGKQQLIFLYAKNAETIDSLEKSAVKATIKQDVVERSLIVYIQLSGHVAENAVQRLSSATGIDAATLPQFLVAPLAKSLSHVEVGDVENRLVVTDLDGKILKNYDSLEKIIDWFRSCR